MLMVFFFVLVESISSCLCCSVEQELTCGGMVATVNGVLYNEVESSQFYGDQLT